MAAVAMRGGSGKLKKKSFVLFEDLLKGTTKVDEGSFDAGAQVGMRWEELGGAEARWWCWADQQSDQQ